jgi:hypothetical protein
MIFAIHIGVASSDTNKNTGKKAKKTEKKCKGIERNKNIKGKKQKTVKNREKDNGAEQ